MREKSKLKCVPQFLFRSYVSHTYVFPSNSNRPHTSLNEAHPNGVRRKTGSDWQTVKTALLTRCMVRPCVARRFRRIGGGGLASMYPASDWSVLCSGPSWISARVRSD